MTSRARLSHSCSAIAPSVTSPLLSPRSPEMLARGSLAVEHCRSSPVRDDSCDFSHYGSSLGPSQCVGTDLLLLTSPASRSGLLQRDLSARDRPYREAPCERSLQKQE